MSLLATLLIGVVAALVGTLVASLIGIGGIDWIELLLQITLAAVCISLYTGTKIRG